MCERSVKPQKRMRTVSSTILHRDAVHILRAYEQQALFLPLEKAGHFFVRAYRLTSNAAYIPFLAAYTLTEKLPRIREDCAMLRAKNFSFMRPPEPSVNPSRNRRYPFYEEHPELWFYDRVLVDLFFFYCVKLSDVIPEWKTLVHFLKRHHVAARYCDPDVISRDGSFAINSSFFLKHLNVHDVTTKVIAIVRALYFVPEAKSPAALRKNLTDEEFYTCLYTLTHILIAASWYYQRRVTQHHWIVRFFAQNYQEIIQRTRTDVLAEVGLAFRLCQLEKKYPRAYRVIRTTVHHRVMSRFDTTPTALIAQEHTNSIALLLLYDTMRYGKGPNLSHDPRFVSRSFV